MKFIVKVIKSINQKRHNAIQQMRVFSLCKFSTKTPYQPINFRVALISNTVAVNLTTSLTAEIVLPTDYETTDNMNELLKSEGNTVDFKKMQADLNFELDLKTTLCGRYTTDEDESEFACKDEDDQGSEDSEDKKGDQFTESGGFNLAQAD